MGVTGKMNRMVLLCMLILSMVSLPTSLARKECTDFLEEALDVLGSAYKTMGPALQDGMNAVMEKKRRRGLRTSLGPSTLSTSTPITSSKSLDRGLGTGRAPVTSWVDNWTLMV